MKHKTYLDQIEDFLQKIISIDCRDSLKEKIDYINSVARNNPDQEVLVLLPNTVGVKKEMIERLENNVSIRISGGYDYERMKSQENVVFRDKKYHRKRPAAHLYFLSVIYSKEETIQILEEIEKIERGMNKEWSDIQKLVYFYTVLKSKITYDPRFKERTDEEVRSLRGLITKETVCAGFSLILKELLDRQGIDCNYVSGHGHAWNIVRIEGKVYPIDLTFENKRYREGVQNSFLFLGHDVKDFNRHHKPDENDPSNGYQKYLSELDSNFLRFIASTVIKEEEYEKTAFKCTKSDNSEVIVIQIGTRTMNKETYYIYYYDKLVNGTPQNRPLILASKETISRYVDNINFGEVNIIHDADIVNKLFSEENIQDSLSKNSAYIGEFESFKMTEGYVHQVKKDPSDLRLFEESPKVYPRDDGSILVIESDSIGPIMLGDEVVYKFNLYDLTMKDNKPILRKRIVYSDRNIINIDYEDIQTKLLSEENITSSIENTCGYIGYLDEYSNIIRSKGVLKYFARTNNVTIEDYEKATRK